MACLTALCRCAVDNMFKGCTEKVESLSQALADFLEILYDDTFSLCFVPYTGHLGLCTLAHAPTAAPRCKQSCYNVVIRYHGN